MTSKNKDYAIRQPTGDVVSINTYREAPWVQTWAKVSYDFRRWLYIGRPELDDQGHGMGLIHAGRDLLVEALRNAVWEIPGVTQKTKQNYCLQGLTCFFEYLDSRHPRCPVTCLGHIDEVVLEDYIFWLRNIRGADTDTGRLSENTARTIFCSTKSVLQHLVHRQALPNGIFPPNPFPNSGRSVKGHKPYSRAVMKKLVNALGRDIKEIRSGRLKLLPKETLTVYLLLIAARSGRNPSALMYAGRDALQPHPIKPNEMAIMKLYKNRGNTTHLLAFRFQKKIEDLASVPMDVISLFREVDVLTAPLVKDAPIQFQKLLWLYRSNKNNVVGKVAVLDSYHESALNIVRRHELKDDDGKPLQLNISRLRATFAMRMWHLTSGDLCKTAKLLGNTPKITDRHYLESTPESEANHRRLGHIMQADLSGALDNREALEALSREVGVPPEQLLNIASGRNNTGVGRCCDPVSGAKAPCDGSFCTRWLACFRCPDQVVMEPDLYRLYSFYFLLIKEHNFVQLERWKEIYGPIITIIDHEIVGPNLRTEKNPEGCFDPLRVRRMKEQAERDPHPMWRSREILASGDIDG